MKWFLLGLALSVSWFAIFSIGGCASTGHSLPNSAESTGHSLPGQSWDQANLKRSDHGCPTAIYIAPAGELEQCERAEVTAPMTINVGGLDITIEQVHPIVAPPKYDTLEQAAIAGLKAIAAKPTALYYEWGGHIVKTKDGKFSALASNTTYEGDHVEIDGDDFGLNGELVAGYHTHPCLPAHDVQYFSPEDLIEPIFFHLTVFMGDFCTGNVHEFIPGDNPAVEHPHGDLQRILLTKGRIVGQFTTPHDLMVSE